MNLPCTQKGVFLCLGHQMCWFSTKYLHGHELWRKQIQIEALLKYSPHSNRVPPKNSKILIESGLYSRLYGKCSSRIKRVIYTKLTKGNSAKRRKRSFVMWLKQGQRAKNSVQMRFCSSQINGGLVEPDTHKKATAAKCAECWWTNKKHFNLG